MNPAQNPYDYQPTEQTDIYHQDYSGRPWAYECYIGKTIEASYLVIENKYKIKKLVLDLPTDAKEYEAEGFDYYADWQDCSWGLFFQKSEKRDKYNVDIYFSHGGPLIEEPFEGIYYDGSAYFEVWYLDNENGSPEENIQFIRIYRNEDEKRETTWTVNIDNIKNTRYLDINNDGPNNGK